MKPTRMYSFLFLLLLTLTLAACGGSKEEPGASAPEASSSGGDLRTIKIGYLPITHAAPLYVEDELGKGKFSHFKLELVKFGSWPDLMDALNSGRIDGASVLIQLAMAAKEQGHDLKTVALGHKEGNVIVTANDIQQPADLKGKTFAIPHKFSTHNLLLYLMLKQAGMSYTDVNVVQLAPAEMPAALAEGRIAGYVVAEPFGAKSVAIQKGKVLFQSADLWKDSIDCALVLRGELIRSDREAVQEFVTEYVKAGQKAEQKDAEGRAILSKYMNVDEKVLDLSLEWIQYDDLRVSEASYEELRKLAVEMGLSQNPPAYQDFVDHSFIDQVK